jgi:hypothetical protein
MFNTVFVYINEAHAIDVWPIGLSAGTLNYSHKSIEDRYQCAIKFKNEHDFKITTYLDNMNNDILNILATWPFRYFVIDYDTSANNYVFVKIAEPENAEFDLTKVFE